MPTCARLLVATPLYPPDPGGPATYAQILETMLPEQGTVVEVVKFGNVRHLPKLVRHLVYFFNVLRSAKHADAILALDPVSVGLPSALVAKLLKKRFYVKVVGDYAWEQGRQRFGLTMDLDTFIHARHMPLQVRVLRALQRYVARQATRIIVPSYYLQNIVGSWGIQQDRISVVYNAVTPAVSSVCPSVLSEVRRPLILTIGRLVPWKHIDGIIDALERVGSEGVPTTLAIVGTGPLEQSLMQKAAESRTDILFLGQQDRRGTEGALASADILVLNSSYEGLSHVLIEALMQGKAIIATNAGGNPELIEDGVNGILIPVGDTPALASAIMRLSEDSRLRALIEEGARASRARFSLPAMITGTITALTQ